MYTYEFAFYLPKDFKFWLVILVVHTSLLASKIPLMPPDVMRFLPWIPPRKLTFYSEFFIYTIGSQYLSFNFGISPSKERLNFFTWILTDLFFFQFKNSKHFSPIPYFKNIDFLTLSLTTSLSFTIVWHKCEDHSSMGCCCECFFKEYLNGLLFPCQVNCVYFDLCIVTCCVYHESTLRSL